MTDQQAQAGNGIRWFIDRDSTNLASGVIANGGGQSFSDGTGGGSLTSVTVTAGQFVYVIVDPNGDYGYDATRLNVTITLR